MHICEEQVFINDDLSQNNPSPMYKVGKENKWY